MPIVSIDCDTNDSVFPDGAYCCLQNSKTPELVTCYPFCYACNGCGCLRHKETNEYLGICPNANCSNGSDRSKPYQKWQGVIIISEHSHGLCIKEYERNGYDDSDFYMTIWDPVKKAPYEHLFATTRGWSYPCYNSRADATPEVMAEYAKWLKASERRSKIQGRWDHRKKLRKLAEKAKLTLPQVKSLEAAPISQHEFKCVLSLVISLNSGRLRSPFKVGLAEQVVSWVKASPESRKHRTPLSPKQMLYV